MNDATTATAPTGGVGAHNASPPSFDFPTWLPPMLVKELRQGLRQRGFVGGIIIVQAVLLFVFVTGFVTETGDGSSRSMIDGFFWSAMGGVLLFGAPLRALGGLSSELDSRTMDLLLLTRLDAWRIVWGKWVSLMTQTVLVAVTLLPYAVVRYFFGAVDLVGDFAIIAGLLSGGAVLTGVGLWASGLPRALRFLVIIGCVMVAASNLGGLFFGLRRSRFSFLGGVTDAWLAWTLAAWAGVLLLVYSLSLAVRWFAPPAENHAILPRLVPLGMVLPAPLLALTGKTDPAAAQAMAALLTLGLVGAIELAGGRELMAIHLRRWVARGSLSGRVVTLFLPGWPSAAAWLAAMAALVVVSWGAADALVAKDLHFVDAAWLVVLAWTGLVFPCLLVSLVPTAGRVSGIIYFVLHGVLGVFAVMSGSDGLSRVAPTSMRVMDWISHAVPTTSFWHALVEAGKTTDLPAVGFGQALGVAVTLTMMLFMARPYWSEVRILRHEVARRPAGASE